MTFCIQNIVFLLLFFQNGGLGQYISSSSSISRHYESIMLLTAGEPQVRPVKEVNQTLGLTLELYLLQILDVDYIGSTIDLKVCFSQEWDSGLKWDPQAYGNIDSIQIPAEEIWTPDMKIYNVAEVTIDPKVESKVKVSSDGRATWAPVTQVQLSCEFDISLENFVDDETQTCILKYASWTYDGTGVDVRTKDMIHQNKSTISKNGIDLSKFILHPEFVISQTHANRNEKYYVCCPEAYLDLTFLIELKRRTGNYKWKRLALPWKLLTFTPALIFLTPSHESRTKVIITGLVFGVSSFLSISEAAKYPFQYLTHLHLFTMTVLLFATAACILLGHIHILTSKRSTSSSHINSTLKGFRQKIQMIKGEDPTKVKEDTNTETLSTDQKGLKCPPKVSEDQQSAWVSYLEMLVLGIFIGIALIGLYIF